MLKGTAMPLINFKKSRFFFVFILAIPQRVKNLVDDKKVIKIYI
jgi:hypothetical protein